MGDGWAFWGSLGLGLLSLGGDSIRCEGQLLEQTPAAGFRCWGLYCIYGPLFLFYHRDLNYVVECCTDVMAVKNLVVDGGLYHSPLIQWSSHLPVDVLYHN